MKILFLIFSSIFCLAPAHDAAIAVFKIYEKGDQTQLFVSIDANDLSNEMGFQIPEMDIEKIDLYLKRNFSVFVDAELASYKIDEFIFEMDHLKVVASFQEMPKEFRSIKILNTCLVDVDGHSNIIQLDLNDKSKDFRMHKGRSEIVVEY